MINSIFQLFLAWGHLALLPSPSHARSALVQTGSPAPAAARRRITARCEAGRRWGKVTANSHLRWRASRALPKLRSCTCWGHGSTWQWSWVGSSYCSRMDPDPHQPFGRASQHTRGCGHRTQKDPAAEGTSRKNGPAFSCWTCSLTLSLMLPAPPLSPKVI